jgi:hypothetical protein
MVPDSSLLYRRLDFSESVIVSTVRAWLNICSYSRTIGLNMFTLDLVFITYEKQECDLL